MFKEIRVSRQAGGKSPPSAPPTIPPIIINPFRYEKPGPAIDPRVDLPRPPVHQPTVPRVQA